jgi:hypothetical protein
MPRPSHLSWLEHSNSSSEIETSSVYWTQLSRFYLRREIQSSLRNAVLKYKQDNILNKAETMDNVQECNNCTNLPSSQTFRSLIQYLSIISSWRLSYYTLWYWHGKQTHSGKEWIFC